MIFVVVNCKVLIKQVSIAMAVNILNFTVYKRNNRHSVVSSIYFFKEMYRLFRSNILHFRKLRYPNFVEMYRRTSCNDISSPGFLDHNFPTQLTVSPKEIHLTLELIIFNIFDKEVWFNPLNLNSFFFHCMSKEFSFTEVTFLLWTNTNIVRMHG